MIKDPTVIVLGAGASFEVNFPLGAKLKERISCLCQRRMEDNGSFQKPTKLEVELGDTTLPNGIGIDQFHAAQLSLAENIEAVDSIDHYLSLNNHSAETVLAGKAAIAVLIARAEKESALSFTPSRDRNTPSFSEPASASASYLHRLWTLLAAEISQRNVLSLFNNLSIISFNYDRSLEWFFFVRLSQALGLSPSQASEVINTLPVIRPYGSIGAWSYDDGGSGPTFGSELRGTSILKAADAIRTLSDDDLSRSVPPYVVQARQAIWKARNIVILGCAFHKPNLEVLNLSSLTAAVSDGNRQVWATAVGLGPLARRLVQSELASVLRARPGSVYVQSIDAKSLHGAASLCFKGLSDVARIREIVFDSVHPASLARFWAALLDGYQVRPYDDAEIARLAARGLTPETDPSVLVDGPGPILCFQQVAAKKSVKNRVHLDIVGAPRAQEVARIIALGGSIRDDHAGFTVMLDPEGNEFCVQDPR